MRRKCCSICSLLILFRYFEIRCINLIQFSSYYPDYQILIAYSRLLETTNEKYYIMGVLRKPWHQHAASGKKWISTLSEKLTTSGVLMSGFFEGLPLHCCVTCPWALLYDLSYYQQYHSRSLVRHEWGSVLTFKV